MYSKTLLASDARQDIQEKVTEMSGIQQKVNAMDLDLKEQAYAISKHTKESSEAANKIKQLLEENDWIQHERHLFGKTDSLFDFEANNPKDMSKRLIYRPVL